MFKGFSVTAWPPLLCAMIVLSPAGVGSQTCVKELDQPVADTSATAGAWANLRNNAGSVRFESGRMLSDALEKLPESSPPAELCAPPCKTSAPLLVFDSSPMRYLDDYGEKDKCDALFAKTKGEPLRFPNRVFRNHEEFNEWLSEFSQGKGEDGGKLYEECPGDCSPRFRTFIRSTEGRLHVNAEVICGPARDKDDNRYSLVLMLRWKCEG